MNRSDRYCALITSLPYHGDLFSSKQTPLSRIQLRQRFLQLEPQDRQDLAMMARLLSWHRQPMERDDATLIDMANQLIPALKNHFLRRLVIWRLEMRSLLAAWRSRQNCDRPYTELKRVEYSKRLRWIVHNWQEPCFRMEPYHPWVTKAKIYFDKDQSYELERWILSQVWEQLDRRSLGHQFDFEAVAIYSMRWDLIRRWITNDATAAGRRFGQLVVAGRQHYHQHSI